MYVVTFIILTVVLLHCTEASGTFKMMLLHYSNPSGTVADESCCDVCTIILDRCDHQLALCLDEHHSSPSDDRNTDSTKCSYWWYNTGRLASGNTNAFREGTYHSWRNPTATNMPSLPAKLQFKVKIWDNDKVTGDDFVDEMYTTLDIKPARSEGESRWIRHDITGRRSKDKTSLTFYIEAFCDLSYFGPHCHTFCEPRDAHNGHYTCDPDTGYKVCLPGYEDNSTNCVIESDDCKGHPCHNGGTCVDGDRTYTCICLSGYTGDRCYEEIDHCASDPCQNGAQCIQSLGQYVCSCTEGFVGVNCQYHYCEVPGACLNGGTCVGHDGQCLCKDGFTGSRCETDLCDQLTCQQRGQCLNGQCACPKGYTGRECEFGPCKQITCLNNGTCKDGVCTCRPGFMGDICEGVQNFCLSRPCQNNGVCFSNTLGYLCKCLPGYEGEDCDKAVEVITPGPCYFKPCENGGLCSASSNNSYTCQCKDGFSGTICETTNKQAATGTEETQVTKNSGLPLWVFIVIAVCVLLLIVAIIVGVIMARRRTKKAPSVDSGTGPETAVNPAFQDDDHVYWNSNESPAHTNPGPNKDINLDIVPKDKVIYDVPRPQPTGAHGASGNSEALMTPKHLKERYRAMQKAAALNKV